VRREAEENWGQLIAAGQLGLQHCNRSYNYRRRPRLKILSTVDDVVRVPYHSPGDRARNSVNVTVAEVCFAGKRLGDLPGTLSA
jgi:hypothetical protein